MSSEREPQTHAERAALGATAGDRERVGQAVERVEESAADHRPVIRGWRDTFNLLALAAAFDGKERGQFEAEAWLTVLRDAPIEDARAAITQHYRGSRFPVMPADIIQILEEGDFA